MVERARIPDVSVYEKITIVRNLLAEKRTKPDNDRKWEWLDFIEINVLTRLSLIAEQMFPGELSDNLPTPAPVVWKNLEKKDVFNRLWDEFMNAGSKAAMKVKLERMFLVWRNYADEYPIPSV